MARAAADSADDPYTPSAGNGGYQVEHYDLTLAYAPETNHLAGRADLTVLALQNLERFSLDLAGLDATKVTVDGQRAERVEAKARKLHIRPRDAVAAGARATVSVTYTGSPEPVTGHAGAAGWDLLTDGVLVASQPDGAASWFPCNDHPSDKASYRITVATDSAYHVVANGELVDRQDDNGTTNWTYEQDEPMATYLASVQIGRYAPVDLGKRPVRQRAFAPSHRVADVQNGFARQRQMLKFFERTFGAYPYRAYTVVVTDDELEVPLGAQGLAVFGANHLGGKAKHERLIAHELAHQWFGCCLTIERWQHIWLNEGFATYAEWLWSEAGGGPTADELARKHWTRVAALPQDIAIADPGPQLMYDERVYRRGALTLHALRGQLGEDGFADLLRTWTSRHCHRTVSTDEFVALVRKRGGKPAAALLKEWLQRKTLPELLPARDQPNRPLT